MNFRKLLLTLSLGMTLATGSIQQANAGAIALVTSPYGLFIALGAGALAFSGVTTVASRSSRTGYLLAMGLLVLDKNSNNIKFNELDGDAGTKIGLSETERSAFNSEIDRVNAASEELNALYQNMTDVEKSSSETPALLKETLLREISKDAYSALSKIMNQSN